MLSTEECLTRLRVEGVRLGAVAEATAFEAPVPGCPGWNVDALLRHVGDVHRWAATIVRQRRQARLRLDSVGPDGREELLGWYRDGHVQLLDVLSAASADDRFWTWAPAPNPLAFWARRQAHETAIHRLDVEQSSGASTSFPARAAADGIDEWLMIASQRAKVPDGGGRSLQVAPTDAGDRWLVELRSDGITVQRTAAGGVCALRAPASDLFAVLMNRRAATIAEVEGDADVLRTWRESVRF